MIIAIDGPAGAGKSTVARKLASKLGWAYLDTGAIFRAITWFLLKNDYPDVKDIPSLLKKLNIEIDAARVYVNSIKIDDEIRTPIIDKYVSDVASLPEIREYAKEVERQIAAKHENIIVEGRDTTTVVFRDAPVKIFLDASIKERAKRRYMQIIEKGLNYITVEDIEKDITERDKKDRSREHAPLSISQDSIVIDTTHLSIDEVVDRIIALINKK